MLFFYPKDDTSGCTIEAIDFTAKLAEFEAADTVVLGISKDSVKSHAKFRDKHGLKVMLLSDESGAVLERFGVWIEKSMYGRKYHGHRALDLPRRPRWHGGSGVEKRQGSQCM